MKLILKKGWNLVSIPINDLNTIISNNNVTEIKTLEKSWNRNIPNIFNTLKSFDIEEGYMISVSDDTVIELPNLNISSITYSIVKGWNLIGWQKNKKLDEIDLTNIEEIKSNNESYNINIPSMFNTLKELKLGVSYWLKSKETFQLQVNFNTINIKSKFNTNFREFDIELISIGSNKESIIKIDNLDLTNNIVFLPGELNSRLSLQKDPSTFVNNNIIVPELKTNESVSFKLRAYNLPNDKYQLSINQFNISKILEIPKIETKDYTNSKYFTNNNLPKLLLISYFGADNDLENYCFDDMVELANLTNKNKENYDICCIGLVDRSNYSSYNDDPRDWYEENTFNITIKDKTFGIYICHSKTNYKWDNYKIGNYQSVLDTMINTYDRISTEKEVFDLYLNLVMENLIENEKNNPNIAISFIMWNHGIFYGICADPKMVNKMLYMEDIQSSLQNTLEKHNIEKLDYLIFDCCLTASLCNLNLFSDITRYFMTASTVIPGFGSYYNFNIPNKTNIKNDFIKVLFEESIGFYKKYYDKLSVFDTDKFKLFNYILKDNLNKTEGIVDVVSNFKKIKHLDRGLPNFKSLFTFVDNNSSEIVNSNKIKELYFDSIIKASNKNNSIALLSSNFFQNGNKMERSTNVNYIYNFFKRQPDKPVITVSFDSLENEGLYYTDIKVNVVGQLKEKIKMLLSNGFSYVNNFQVIEGDAEIIKIGFRTYLQVNDINKKIVVKSNNLISLIYVNGVKFYQEKSRFFDLLDIKGDDYDIDNFSESLELSKLNIANIIGNSQYYFSNILSKVQDEMVEITGNILMNDNVVVNYGNIYEDYLYGSIIEQNDQLIQNELNLKTKFPSVYLNDQLFYLLEFEKIDNIFRITLPCLFQEKFDDRGPNFNSRIVNLQLIIDEDNNIISKKLWNSYGIITNEIFVEKGIIYPLIISTFDPMSEDNKIIELNNINYNYKINKDSFINFEDINNLLIINEIDDIYFELRKDDRYITFVTNKKTNLEVLVNSTNIVAEINSNDNNLPEEFFTNPLWNKKWQELTDSEKKNLLLLEWYEDDFNDFVDGKGGIYSTRFFTRKWNSFRGKAKNAMIELGYNKYNWDFTKFAQYNWDFPSPKYKKIILIEEDILLGNQKINLDNIFLIIPSGKNLFIGKDSEFTIGQNSIVLNIGNLVVQDNGILVNNSIIINSNFSNLVVTSGSKKNIGKLENNFRIENESKGRIFITGHSIMENKNTINNNGVIYVTSLNPSYLVNGQYTYSSRSFAKLFNLKDSIISSTKSKIFVEYGSELIFEADSKYIEGEVTVTVYKDEREKENPLIISKLYSKSNDVEYKDKNGGTKKITIKVNNLFYQMENLLGVYYFGSFLTYNEIKYYLNSELPNLNVNVTENNTHLLVKCSNTSNYSSSSFFDKIRIYVESKNYKNYINGKSIDFDPRKGLFSNDGISHKIESVDRLELWNMLLSFTEIYIQPGLKYNDFVVLPFNKYKLAESINAFNEEIKIQFYVDPQNTTRESNEFDNSTTYYFRVEK